MNIDNDILIVQQQEEIVKLKAEIEKRDHTYVMEIREYDEELHQLELKNEWLNSRLKGLQDSLIGEGVVDLDDLDLSIPGGIIKINTVAKSDMLWGDRLVESSIELTSGPISG